MSIEAHRNGHVPHRSARYPGIGISPKRCRAVERFLPRRPIAPRRHAHAGLGLSIVKSYVDLMGGTNPR